MRIRTIVAASLGAVTLAVTALSAAPAARADVGDVGITFFNASGTIIGTAQDVFGNLTMAQCDGNNMPPGTASEIVTNLTDQTVQVGTKCNGRLRSVPAATSETLFFTAGPGDPDGLFGVLAPPGA